MFVHWNLAGYGTLILVYRDLTLSLRSETSIVYFHSLDWFRPTVFFLYIDFTCLFLYNKMASIFKDYTFERISTHFPSALLHQSSCIIPPSYGSWSMGIWMPEQSLSTTRSLYTREFLNSRVKHLHTGFRHGLVQSLPNTSPGTWTNDLEEIVYVYQFFGISFGQTVFETLRLRKLSAAAAGAALNKTHPMHTSCWDWRKKQIEKDEIIEATPGERPWPLSSNKMKMRPRSVGCKKCCLCNKKTSWWTQILVRKPKTKIENRK